LQSVTFSTADTSTTSRSITIVALDANDLLTSNSAAESVNVLIAAPIAIANQTSVSATAGQTVVVDSAMTVSSYDTDVTGAAVTIGTGFQSGSDMLYFANQNGISGSYADGVLTLTGSATPAQYQTALQSVAFSSTSTSTLARSIAIVVNDTNATGNVSGDTATTQIVVSAPVTIIGAYVSGSAWSDSGATTNFDGYLASHGLGDVANPALGYTLQTGSAQLTVLPWANINTISVQFSGPVSNIGLGSLKLVGGTGGNATGAATRAPSVTGFTSDGNNTYSWTLSANLTNNKYVFAIATTGSSFGTPGSTQVTDGNGAGISGTFTTTSSAFPSGNGLAGSTFDFFFNVLPGNGLQNGLDNSIDTAEARSLLSDNETSGGYNAYFDYNGAGLISSIDSAIDSADSNDRQSGITAPTAPSDSQVGGTNSAGQVGGLAFTALALGVQETGSPQATSLSKSIISNVTAVGTTSTSTASIVAPNTSSINSANTTASITASTTLASQATKDQATDEAVSEFDLADLYV